jgi:hypothetical protein
MAEQVAYHEREQAIPAGKERKALREQLLGEKASRALAFQTVAVRHFGAEAGIFIRQLLYRDGSGKDGNFWIYKSIPEWHEETGLGRKLQEKARKRLVGAGVMDEEKRIAPDHRQTWHFRVNPWKLMEVLGDDLPHAKVKPGVYTVPLREQGPCSLNGTGTLPTRGTGYTEDYAEDYTKEISPLSPPRGAEDETKKEKAGSVRGPSDTSSFGDKPDPAQNRAGQGKVKERSPRKPRRSRAGTVQTPDEGLQALTDHRDRLGGASMERYVPVAKRWDFTEDNPPWWVMKELDNDHKKLDRIERIVRGAIRKAEVDALNAKKERGHPSPDSPLDAPVQASPSLADPNSVEAILSADKAQEAENTALLKAYMKAYPEECAFDGF